MTIIANLRTAVLAAIAGSSTLSGVQIVGHPAGEDQALRESVWVETVDSESKWRSMGRGATAWARNRTEAIELAVRVDVYREAPRQLDACEAAFARCEVIVGAIDDAIGADPFLGTLSTTAARVASIRIETAPRESGWAAVGRLTVEAENHPA